MERFIASADGEQIKQHRFTEGESASKHQLFLKEEQIKIKRIENKAMQERRQQELVYEQGPDQAQEMENELAMQKARFQKQI